MCVLSCLPHFPCPTSIHLIQLMLDSEETSLSLLVMRISPFSLFYDSLEYLFIHQHVLNNGRIRVKCMSLKLKESGARNKGTRSQA